MKTGSRGALLWKVPFSAAGIAFSDRTRLFSEGKWVTSRFREKDVLPSPGLRVIRVSEHR